MKNLVIDNIGPIKHVELNLKRVNVIIGPQSAGKSCILKIACFCAWTEKRIQLEQGENGFSDFEYIKKNLIHFHRLEGFIRKSSFIRYSCDTLSFTIDFDEESFCLKWAESRKRYSFKRPRVSYIPAERNLVSSIPNWFDVKMDNTNLKSFISDWSYAHKLCNSSTMLPILDLGVSYFYDPQSDKDFILLDEGNKMNLANASSGLQSIIPMWVYLDYLFHKQYLPNEMSSTKTESENEEIAQHIYESRYMKNARKAGTGGQLFYGKTGMAKRPFASKEDFDSFKSMIDDYTVTSHSDIYLEEPEQNLFPKTQLDLIYSLLHLSKGHSDNIFIATHSPYILYALNNCMLGGMVCKKIDKQEIETYTNRESWISPKEVSVWELKDGCFSSRTDSKFMTLQDEDGLIRGNYFDAIMKLVMSDFTNLSSYYE